MAVALAAAASPVQADSDRGLLSQYRPTLALDSDERLRPASVDELLRSGGVRPSDGGSRIAVKEDAGGAAAAVYGRVMRADRGRRRLQYWIFYTANTQDRGIVRTGRHAGDWEVVQVEVSKAGEPEAATLAQHSWAERCSWSRLRRDGEAPLLFVAGGSHAAYSRRGSTIGRSPTPTTRRTGGAADCGRR